MIELKLLIIAACAGLKLVGELWWHNAQRYILPVLLGLSISYFSHVWWLGFTTLPMIGILVLGYGDKSPLKHGLGDASARGMWLFLVTVMAGLGPFLTHHLAWYFYIPYCLIAGILGATLRNIWNVIGSLICGAWIGFIIFWIH